MEEIVSKIRSMPELLTVSEVAEVLRICKMTIYRAVNSGELESLRVGRSFRIPREAVVTYLKQGHRSNV